jgi:hypothetical protein
LKSSDRSFFFTSSGNQDIHEALLIPKFDTFILSKEKRRDKVKACTNMTHCGYRQWPFLTLEEFEVACAHFDQRYIQAKLGPTRKIFKISQRRTLTTGATYVEIVRLLQLSEDQDDLIRQLENLRGGAPAVSEQMDIDMATAEDEDNVGDPSSGP